MYSFILQRIFGEHLHMPSTGLASRDKSVNRLKKLSDKNEKTWNNKHKIHSILKLIIAT